MPRILLAVLLLGTLCGTPGCALLTKQPVAAARQNPFDSMPAAAQVMLPPLDWLTPFSAIEMEHEQRMQSIEDEFFSFFAPAKPTAIEKPKP